MRLRDLSATLIPDSAATVRPDEKCISAQLHPKAIPGSQCPSERDAVDPAKPFPSDSAPHIFIWGRSGIPQSQ